MELWRRWITNAAKRFGFVPSQMNFAADGKFYLYRYESDGRFDYEKYRSVQVEGNKRKITKVWTERPIIEGIAKFLTQQNPSLSRGICHGSRNGSEVAWFRELLNADVIGTDISETATQFPNMVQWDFHETNPEWVGAFDFVYTNSQDHAYDPAKALRAWVSQLRPGGWLILEHCIAHGLRGASELDPFAIDEAALPYFVLNIANGEFAVTRLFRLPYADKPEGYVDAAIFCIQKV